MANDTVDQGPEERGNVIRLFPNARNGQNGLPQTMPPDVAATVLRPELDAKTPEVGVAALVEGQLGGVRGRADKAPTPPESSVDLRDDAPVHVAIPVQGPPRSARSLVSLLSDPINDVVRHEVSKVTKLVDHKFSARRAGTLTEESKSDKREYSRLDKIAKEIADELKNAPTPMYLSTPTGLSALAEIFRLRTLFRTRDADDIPFEAVAKILMRVWPNNWDRYINHTRVCAMRELAAKQERKNIFPTRFQYMMNMFISHPLPERQRK